MFSLYTSHDYYWLIPNINHPLHASNQNALSLQFVPTTTPQPDELRTNDSQSQLHSSICLLIDRNTQHILLIDKFTGKLIVDQYLLHIFGLSSPLQRTGVLSVLSTLPTYPLPNTNTLKRDVYGILGCHRLLRGLYLEVITSVESTVNIYGHTIYRVADIEVLALSNKYNRQDLNFNRTLVEEEENNIALLRNSTSSLTLYFSYTYDITLTMQKMYDFAYYATLETSKPPQQSENGQFTPQLPLPSLTYTEYTNQLFSRAESTYFTNSSPMVILFTELVYTYQSLLTAHFEQLEAKLSANQLARHQKESPSLPPPPPIVLPKIRPLGTVTAPMPNNQSVSSLGPFAVIASHCLIHTTHHLAPQNSSKLLEMTKFINITRFSRHNLGPRNVVRGINQAGQAGNFAQVELITEVYRECVVAFSPLSNKPDNHDIPTHATKLESNQFSLFALASYVFFRGSPPYPHVDVGGFLSPILLQPITVEFPDHIIFDEESQKNLQKASKALQNPLFAPNTPVTSPNAELKQATVVQYVEQHCRAIITSNYPPTILSNRSLTLDHSAFDNALQYKVLRQFHRFPALNMYFYPNFIHPRYYNVVDTITGIATHYRRYILQMYALIEKGSQIVDNTIPYDDESTLFELIPTCKEPFLRVVSLLGGYTKNDITTNEEETCPESLEVLPFPLTEYDTTQAGSALEINSRIGHALGSIFSNYAMGEGFARTSKQYQKHLGKVCTERPVGKPIKLKKVSEKDEEEDTNCTLDDDIQVPYLDESKAIPHTVFTTFPSANEQLLVCGLTHIAAREGCFLAISPNMLQNDPTSKPIINLSTSHMASHQITYLHPPTTSLPSTQTTLTLYTPFPQFIPEQPYHALVSTYYSPSSVHALQNVTSLENVTFFQIQRQSTISRYNCMDCLDRVGKTVSYLTPIHSTMLSTYLYNLTQSFNFKNEQKNPTNTVGLIYKKLTILMTKIRNFVILYSLGLKDKSPGQSQFTIKMYPERLQRVLFEQMTQTCEEFTSLITSTFILHPITWHKFSNIFAKIPHLAGLSHSSPESILLYTSIHQTTDTHNRECYFNYKNHFLSPQYDPATGLQQYTIYHSHQFSNVGAIVDHNNFFAISNYSTVLRSHKMANAESQVKSDESLYKLYCTAENTFPLHFIINFAPFTQQLLAHSPQQLSSPQYSAISLSAYHNVLSMASSSINMMNPFHYISLLQKNPLFHHLRRRFRDSYSYGDQYVGLLMYFTKYRPNKAILPITGYAIRQIGEIPEQTAEKLSTETAEPKSRQTPRYGLVSITDEDNGFGKDSKGNNIPIDPELPRWKKLLSYVYPPIGTTIVPRTSVWNPLFSAIVSYIAIVSSYIYASRAYEDNIPILATDNVSIRANFISSFISLDHHNLLAFILTTFTLFVPILTLFFICWMYESMRDRIVVQRWQTDPLEWSQSPPPITFNFEPQSPQTNAYVEVKNNDNSANTSVTGPDPSVDKNNNNNTNTYTNAHKTKAKNNKKKK